METAELRDQVSDLVNVYPNDLSDITVDQVVQFQIFLLETSTNAMAITSSLNPKRLHRDKKIKPVQTKHTSRRLSNHCHVCSMIGF